MSWSSYTDGSIAAYGMSARNCTDFPTLLPANPDISGIGVRKMPSSLELH